MAVVNLLGSEACIESLSRDVSFLQQTIKIILEKTGKLPYTSWKYPRENSSDLDVAELLENYMFSEDEELNRLSHIILFELVIDRFCLLLQAICKLFSDVCNFVDEEENPYTVTSTISVGLVVKNFWNKMIKVEKVLAERGKQVNNNPQPSKEINKNDNIKLSSVNDMSENDVKEAVVKLPDIHPSQSLILQNNLKDEKIMNDTQSTTQIKSREKKSKLTQTYETAFLPCEYCEMMKENLLHVGASVIEICETHSLPSSLSKLKRMVEESDMTANDMKRWSQDQCKDIDKINDYLSKLDHENKDLLVKNKDILKDVEKTKIMLSQREIEFASFNNVRSELEKSLLEKTNEYIELKEKVRHMEIKSDESAINIKELNVSLENMTNNYDKEKKLSTSLEESKNLLSGQVKSLQEENVRITTLLKELETSKSSHEKLTTELHDNEEQLKKLKTDLDKMAAQNKVLLSHDESLQKKISNLLARLEKMEEEHDELNEEINLLKDENESLVNEKKKLVEENKRKFSDNESTNDLLHQLKLVINYPVYSKKYKTAEADYIKVTNQSEYKLSGDDVDVVKDMKNQLEANDIRISVLKDENKTLENTLKKLNIDVVSQPNVAMMSQPNTNFEEQNIDFFRSIDKEQFTKPRNNSAPMTLEHSTQQETIMPRPPSQPRKTALSSRPRSGNKMDVLDISSKLAQLDKLKNSKKISPIAKTKSAWNTNESLDSEVVCPDCDKTYLSQQDLQIHRGFCYGRI